MTHFWPPGRSGPPLLEGFLGPKWPSVFGKNPGDAVDGPAKSKSPVGGMCKHPNILLGFQPSFLVLDRGSQPSTVVRKDWKCHSRLLEIFEITIVFQWFPMIEKCNSQSHFLERINHCQWQYWKSCASNDVIDSIGNRVLRMMSDDFHCSRIHNTM